MQGHCHHAFVRLPPSAKASWGVMALNESFANLYGVCCDVLWGEIGTTRVEERLRDEWVVEEIHEDLIGRACEPQINTVTDESGSDLNAASSATSEGELSDESEVEDEGYRQITGFHPHAKNCKCLDGACLPKARPERRRPSRDSLVIRAIRRWKSRPLAESHLKWVPPIPSPLSRKLEADP
ncbi:hypothetical protein M426DRAFT_321334 [Hypoxylon sp. CI-4A]|nr:hypothetical protein M426DRAFT_321334 [Hypoxylon sp. CI-4A]